MYYDKKAVGERIRKERIAAGFKSQSKLALELGYSVDSRQSIGAWEKGERLPSLDDFIKLCEIFECELGYLLGEYDCKTRTATDITAATGLSEKAVNKLIQTNRSERSEIMGTLRLMIEHEDFLNLLSAVHVHFWNFKKGRFKIDPDDAARMADVMGCEKTEVNRYVEASSKSLLESIFSRIVENLENAEEKSTQKSIFPTKAPGKGQT